MVDLGGVAGGASPAVFVLLVKLEPCVLRENWMNSVVRWRRVGKLGRRVVG